MAVFCFRWRIVVRVVVGGGRERIAQECDRVAGVIASVGSRVEIGMSGLSVT